MDYHLTWYKCFPIEAMCSDLDPYPYLKGQGHTIHLKVRVHMLVSALKLMYTLMDYHLNLVQILSLMRLCAYIQEYLGYRSNHLYFLFSHSWPVVVYNFGQVQRTSEVERKTKCSKKTTAGTALFCINFPWINCTGIIESLCRKRFWTIYTKQLKWYVFHKQSVKNVSCIKILFEEVYFFVH